MGFETLLRQFAIGLNARLIQPQLNHRQIRSRRLQVITQLQSRKLHFRTIEFVKRRPKMHKHQIALVPEHGIKRRLSGWTLLHLVQKSSRLLNDFPREPRTPFPPPPPATPHHLMQHAVALNREWHSRNFSRSSLRTSGAG